MLQAKSGLFETSIVFQISYAAMEMFVSEVTLGYVQLCDLESTATLSVKYIPY